MDWKERFLKLYTDGDVVDYGRAHRKGGAQRAVIKNCLQYISTHLREDLRLEGTGARMRAVQPQPVAEIQGGGRLRHTGVHPPR